MVASPPALVGLVGELNSPAPVASHETVLPGAEIRFPFTSINCAVTVTVAPVKGSSEPGVITYCDGRPGTDAIAALVPVRPPPSSAVTVYTLPETVLTVN